jgi:group I intron endonuclease
MDTTISINHNFIVYKHTNKINNKVYIGITGNSTQKRWKNGYGYSESHHPHFYSAIQKYGWDNFTHEIIADNLTEEEALLLEEKLIREYDATNREKGYNTELSGIKGHYKHTEETKKKISETQKGEKGHMWGKHLTEETKRKMSEKLSGEKHPMYGKHHTEETKEKLRKANSGKNSPLYGTHLTEEAKNHLSEIKKGENNYNYGKHLSEDTKEKISQKLKGITPWNKGKKCPNNKTNKGYHWYNDGIKNVLLKECPEGYKKGRI